MNLEPLTEVDLKAMLGAQILQIEQLARYIQKLEAALEAVEALDAPPPEPSHDGAVPEKA